MAARFGVPLVFALAALAANTLPAACGGTVESSGADGGASGNAGSAAQGGTQNAGGDGPDSSSQGGTSSGGTPGSGASGGVVVGGAAGSTGGAGGWPEACAPQEARPFVNPADIVWAVDTSCSMIEEAGAVEQNVNRISEQVSSAGVDLHVVMIAAYPYFVLPGVCVPAPLGSGTCPDDSKLPGFFHHPTGVIDSVDAALKLVTLFPEYSASLRADARKYLIVITDDDSRNTGGSGSPGPYDNDPDRFIADFTALDPTHRDAAGERTWNLSAVYSFTSCINAAAEGMVWRQIVDTTGGVHGDICGCADAATCEATMQAAFDDIAAMITKAASGPCSYAIPPPPNGGPVQPDRINVELVDAVSGLREIAYHVENEGQCDPTLGGWYYDDRTNPTQIRLCPATCAQIEANTNARVEVLYGCATRS